MPIMKARQLQREESMARESAIVMDLADLEREASNIVSSAKAEAARLLTEGRAAAQREALRIREESRLAGQKDGYEAGMERGRQEGHDEALVAVAEQLKQLAARWSQTLELLHQNMPTHLADTKMDVVRLALAVAARVTRQEGLVNRQVAPAVAEEVLRMIGAARKVTLHVNSVEVGQLERYMPELLKKLRSIEEVTVTVDDSVTEGGCVLRCGAGEIDARLETQIQRISEEMMGAGGPQTTGADGQASDA